MCCKRRITFRLCGKFLCSGQSPSATISIWTGFATSGKGLKRIVWPALLWSHLYFLKCEPFIESVCPSGPLSPIRRDTFGSCRHVISKLTWTSQTPHQRHSIHSTSKNLLTPPVLDCTTLITTSNNYCTCPLTTKSDLSRNYSHISP